MKLSNGESIEVVSGSSAVTVISSSGAVTGTSITATGQIVNPLSAGSTTANLPAYGVSTISYSSAANTYTLDAPITGVEKTIIMNSTKVADSTAISTSVYTGSTAIFIMDNSTTYNPKLYVNFLPPYASAKLVGLSTSLWGVVGSHGAVQFSTAITYSS